jgi:hypothetical protein
MRRLMILLLALPTLAACNQVYTRQPLMSEAREQGDPEFRPGLWKIDMPGDDLIHCQFDIRKNRRDWPACAVGLEVRRDQMFLVTGHDRALAETYRLVDGEPILLQLHLHTDILRDSRVPEPKDTDNPFYGWMYAGITVRKTDAAARVTEAELVWADCGPLPPNTDPALTTVTSRPYPGLTVVTNNCMAKDLDAVKNALAESAKSNTPVPIRWIRDNP